ncbi:hypothetical protein ACKVWM_008228 [Pyricularia oryzae]
MRSLMVVGTELSKIAPDALDHGYQQELQAVLAKGADATPDALAAKFSLSGAVKGLAGHLEELPLPWVTPLDLLPAHGEEASVYASQVLVEKVSGLRLDGFTLAALVRVALGAVPVWWDRAA